MPHVQFHMAVVDANASKGLHVLWESPGYAGQALGDAGDWVRTATQRRLPGWLTDRLPEEKARGMTIDLGFAHLELEDPDDAETTFNLGIIDVPGHADFVKNMVAGVGSVDVALFVVAADDLVALCVYLAG